MCKKAKLLKVEKEITEFQNGALICIASRMINNKISEVYNLITNIIKKSVSILVFSLDSSTKIFKNDIKNIRLKEQFKNDIYILDDILEITDIEKNTKKYKIQNNIEMVVINYLQLVKFTGLDEAEKEVIIRLKKLAQELDIPIIILSQLSRKVEEREDKKPILLDFGRSSAIIEDYADVVIFLYSNNEKHNLVEVNYIKGNKNGIYRV